MNDGGAAVIGVDVGGTFVDCVAVTSRSGLAHSKGMARPHDPVGGVVAALDRLASDGGQTLSELLAGTRTIVHGTTAGVNALLTRTGSSTGLLTTRGHEDAVLIGRIHQKVAGLPPDAIMQPARLDKPAPLVPRWLIRGIHERIDARGKEVVALDEAQVADAVDELIAAGCEAVAVGFLWSFLNPAHEQAAGDLIRRRAPHVHVSLSSDVAPIIGEYERTATTVINAYLARPMSGYLARLATALGRHGFQGLLLMMLSSAGVVPAQAIAEQPVEVLRSGPVGGVDATRRLGSRLGLRDLISTDVGGTSFDVSVISDGEPTVDLVPVVEQFHLAVQAIEVRSIGAGGGSVAWVDPDGQLKIGPRSAGADPGPACYGRGGLEATVTDADLFLGRLNADAAPDDGLRFDRDGAAAAIDRLARDMGLDMTATAAGIVRIADARMADLLRTVTVEAGHDPARFTLVAFGGAAPLHVGAYAAEVGARRAIVPAFASVFSAYGLALAEWRRVYARSDPARMPADPERVSATFGELEARARRDHEASGLGGTLELHRSVELRYARQTHHLATMLQPGPIDAAALVDLVDRFETDYARLHGEGTGYPAAGIEATTFRLVASAPRHSEDRTCHGSGARTEADAALTSRRVYFGRWFDDTPVYEAARLPPGVRVEGPAVIDAFATTLVVHPGQSVDIDEGLNLHLVLQ